MDFSVFCFVFEWEISVQKGLNSMEIVTKIKAKISNGEWISETQSNILKREINI